KKYYAKFPSEDFEWQKEVVFDHKHSGEHIRQTYCSWKIIFVSPDNLIRSFPGFYISEKAARAAIEKAYTAERTPEPCIQLVWESDHDYPVSHDVIAEWYPGRKEWKEIGRLKRLLVPGLGVAFICWVIAYPLTNYLVQRFDPH